MTSVKLWVVSLFDHADDTADAWAVVSQDLVVASIKREMHEKGFENLLPTDVQGDDFWETLDEIRKVLDNEGYTLSIVRRDVEL